MHDATIHYLRESARRLEIAASYLEARDAFHLERARALTAGVLDELALVVRRIDRAQEERNALMGARR
jgi:hypothetical protein